MQTRRGFSETQRLQVENQRLREWLERIAGAEWRDEPLMLAKWAKEALEGKKW